MWRIKFLSTPSARRATFAVTAKRRKGNKFLSTPSARRATFWWADVPRICIEFLSTPSARRATEGGEYSRAGEWISIHALREEGDLHTGHHAGCAIDISIHALREEGDAAQVTPHEMPRNFYPRPPRGGRRIRPLLGPHRQPISIHALREEGDTANVEAGVRRAISIHALREEGDRWRPAQPSTPGNFYPRPPRGGRPESSSDRVASRLFLSTPSARRATALRRSLCARS